MVSIAVMRIWSNLKGKEAPAKVAGAGHFELPSDAKFGAAHGFFTDSRSEIGPDSRQVAGHRREGQGGMRCPVVPFEHSEIHFGQKPVIVFNGPKVRRADVGAKGLAFVDRKSLR